MEKPYKFYVILFSFFSLGTAEASDFDEYYYEEVLKIRDVALTYFEKASEAGLGTPPLNCRPLGEWWPPFFVKYLDNYSDFRNGFFYLFNCCRKDYISTVKYNENLVVYFEESLKENPELEADIITETVEYIAELKNRIQREHRIYPNVQDILHEGWEEVHKQFGVIVNNYKGEDPLFCYQNGLFLFEEGKTLEAIDLIQKILETGQASKILAEANQVISNLDFAKGLIEIGEYQKAIELLSQVIEEAPGKKEAYFERAAAYFELGQFDLSLEDYLRQRKSSPAVEMENQNLMDFGKGILIGAKNGAAESSLELVPSLLGSLQGIGKMLWATLEHPIQTPKQFVVATIDFCNFLKSCPKKELTQILVPEMYQLVVDWDSLSSQRRGELTGYVLGKYGTDIFLGTAVFKGVKYVQSYRKIQKVEKLCTLETLVNSPEKKAALIDASIQWSEKRAQYFSTIQLEAAKQAKHIPGRKNFIAGNSEWKHPQPEESIKKFAGKGQKVRGEPGQPGYRERVDCGETIGYFMNINTKEKLPTTMAIIHYSKKGAHIVPAAPKK